MAEAQQVEADIESGATSLPRCLGGCWRLISGRGRRPELGRAPVLRPPSYGAASDDGTPAGDWAKRMPARVVAQRQADTALVQDTVEIVKTTCCFCEVFMVVPSFVLGVLMLWIGMAHSRDCFGKNHLDQVFTTAGILNIVVAIAYAVTCRGGQRAVDYFRDFVLYEQSSIYNDEEVASILNKSQEIAWRDAVGWGLIPAIILLLAVIALDMCWIYGISQAAIASQQDSCVSALVLFWVMLMVDLLFQCCGFAAGGPLAILSVLWRLASVVDNAAFGDPEEQTAGKPQKLTS
mmetsp:Transcript_48637/g.89650  ORF Transcript_48637/g.89650 Transcript_48637/m.89650 type:complete len:292 (+) Transcript_48637:97-972(+)